MDVLGYVDTVAPCFDSSLCEQCFDSVLISDDLFSTVH